MSAPSLFYSLLKNKAVTIPCAGFFFYYFYCLLHTGLYEKLYAHYSLTLFITENSVAVTVLGTKVNNTKFLFQRNLGNISFSPFNNYGGGWSKFLVFYKE